MIAQHIAGSLFAMLSWWLANNMPYTPEEMAEMAHILCTEGITSMFDPVVAAHYPSALEKLNEKSKGKLNEKRR